METEPVAPTAAARVLDEMEQLVAISTPSGELEGAERAVGLCLEFLGEPFAGQRLPCSTELCAPDLLATARGTGSGRVLLLGHIDTVIGHDEHRVVTREGGRLRGSGTVDMKGGVAMSLAVARAIAERAEEFEELAVLLVCDEEWRTAEFRHAARFDGYDACLCFEAGERTQEGQEAVIVQRKGAGTLRVLAHGVASHSGVAPERGRNALLALASTALTVAATHAPDSPERLTVVPTVVRSGEAINVVPAAGELIVDIRSDDTDAFRRVFGAVPAEVDGVTLEPIMERVWPALDSRAATEPLLARAGELLGRPIVGRGRGGASDASHFAPGIPLTVDGLGPIGGGAHTPQEWVDADSIGDRLAVALALTRAALDR